MYTPLNYNSLETVKRGNLTSVSLRIILCFFAEPERRPWWHEILALCPEHPKRDQHPKFTPLSETTSIPVCFIWESPPPPPGTQTWRFHTKLYKFGWHTSANNSRMKNSRDLMRGCLFSNYLSSPRFLTFFIEWFRFLVLIS